jgi:hypothetical protein
MHRRIAFREEICTPPVALDTGALVIQSEPSVPAAGAAPVATFGDGRKRPKRTSRPLAAPFLPGDMAAIANWLFMSRNGARICPLCMALPYDQLFKELRRHPAADPAALKQSVDGRRIAPHRLKHNFTVHILHNFSTPVENT